MKLGDEITDRLKGFKTFTSNDVRILLSGEHRHISGKTIQVTLSRMVKTGKLYRVTKGVFSLYKRAEFAGFAFTPFYYGGLAALMIMDLIDDQVKMEVMTTKIVKRSFIEVFSGESRIVLHHLPRKYYFGFRGMNYGGVKVPVSDPEKTLIDLFYYKERLSIQDYAEILKTVQVRKLKDYLKVYDMHTKKAVLNFVDRYKPLADLGKMDNPY